MEFGTQQRQQVQDPHGNVQIDPPALRVTPRDTLTKRTHEDTGLSEGLTRIGNTLGQALQKNADVQEAKSREILEQETIARNALETSVHKEDEKLKRSGWGLELFGQNPQFAIAQEITSKNAIQQRAMELNSRIDDYTEMNPLEFKNVLNKNLESILAGYDDDKEVRHLLSKEWTKQVPNIVRNQYDSWYANSQKQIFDSTKTSILTNADNWHLTLDTALNNGNDDVMGNVLMEATEFLSSSGKHKGMTNKAWRNAKLESTNTSLSAGNKSLYDLMKRTGELDNLEPQEESKLRTSLGVYDTKFKQQIDALYANTVEELSYVDDLDEATEIVIAFEDELKGAELYRSTGSDYAKLVIQRGEKDAALALQKKQAMIETALLKVSKAEVKKQQDRRLVDSFKLPWADKISVHAEGVHTQSDIEGALDKSIYEDLEKLGVDTSSPEAVGATIIRDPQLSEVVAKKLSTESVKSPMMKSLIKSMANGWENMFDESGKLSGEGALILQNLNKFRQYGTLENYISSADAKQLEFVTSRVTSGVPLVAIQKDLTDFNKRYDNVVSGVYRDKGQSQLDADLEFVNKIAKSVYQRDISRSEQFSLRDKYREGLAMYKNDHKSAAQYVRARLDDDATIVNGLIVQNATKVNNFNVTYTDDNNKSKTEQLSLETVINGGNKHLTPYLAASKGLSPEAYIEQSKGTSLADQKLQVEVNEEDPTAIDVSFPDSIQSMTIPQEALQYTADAVFRKKQLEEEIQSRINMSRRIPNWQTRTTQ